MPGLHVCKESKEDIVEAIGLTLFIVMLGWVVIDLLATQFGTDSRKDSWNENI